MMCSTQTIVMPRCARIESEHVRGRVHLGMVEPPSDSSASSSFGCVASARASSSFFSPRPPALPRARFLRWAGSRAARLLLQAQRLLGGPAFHLSRKTAASATFSSRLSFLNGRGIW